MIFPEHIPDNEAQPAIKWIRLFCIIALIYQGVSIVFSITRTIQFFTGFTATRYPVYVAQAGVGLLLDIARTAFLILAVQGLTQFNQFLRHRSLQEAQQPDANGFYWLKQGFLWLTIGFMLNFISIAINFLLPFLYRFQ